ncbi:MAG TPA: YceI family protein [Bryobacteraceae bacterium]|nr:YceI family protein [Bryobacteraceae bacterium]HOQ47034.1 YceI family protein [Bryobacteraceae bacterium]HPQ16119.1 YceI family protein [Bryobacteraceae bacterium]HPU71093.1 YceI family protein [Bryobacteraceae bacterium]
MLRLLILLPVAAVAWAQAVNLEIDRSRSYIAAATRKGGFLSAFGAGHEHGVLATQWAAAACIDREAVSASRAAVIIPTASLRIDTPEARKLAGLEPGGPDPDDVAKIQQTMLGPKFFAAASHPRIRFQTTEIRRNGDSGLLLKGPLTIRGVTRDISLPVDVSMPAENTFRFEGKFQIKQTDFGMKPESVAGAVTVKDEVDVHVVIFATAAGECR